MSLPWLMSNFQELRIKDPLKIDFKRLEEKNLKIKNEIKNHLIQKN